MIFIKHRCNRAVDLASVDPRWGVEIDLRSDVSKPGAIHLSHDPWILGEGFETWLDAFKARGVQGPVILNTKEDGLETRARELMSQRGLESYFFLDTAQPTLVRWTRREGERRFAVRVSAYEPAEGVGEFRGYAEWAWIDCFDGVPLAPEKVPAGFKACLVSPELQGKPFDEIVRFGALVPKATAICTKDPARWMREFGLTATPA